MLEDAVIWIFAAGVIQALFLSAALATINIRNRAATGFLAAAMWVLAIMLIEQTADAAGAPVELALGLATEFALAPLLYLFVRAVISPEEFQELSRAKVKGIALLFTPLSIALALLALMHANNQDGNLGVAHPRYGSLITFWVLVKFAYFACFAVVTERALRHALASAKATRTAVFRWVRRWLLATYAGFAASYALFFAFLIGAPIWRDSDTYAGLVISISIFSIAYFILANRKALDYLPPKAIAVSAEDRRNADLISAYLTREKPYLDPEFTIETLCAATHLGTDKAHSAIIAIHGVGFSECVNRLRLREFEVLAASKANKAKTTLELAFEAGFSSKATFYRAFKAQKGVTPKEFRERLKFA